MSRVLYLDCSAGAAGDMLLSALLDLGVPWEALQAVLAPILPPGASIERSRVIRSGVTATAFRVHESHVPHTHPDSRTEAHGHHHGADHAHHPAHEHTHHHHVHRPVGEVLALIDRTSMSERAKATARRCYERLAEAEAAVHGMTVAQVHLHEVGALDSVVDVVGVVWAMEHLGVNRIVSSPANVGSGRVQTAHGSLPVPAPATLRLLAGAPVFSDGTPHELLTPTGALLLTTFVTTWGPMPAMVVEQVGYGAGTLDVQGRPNVVQAVLGTLAEAASGDRVLVIETNVDDTSPQVLGALMPLLFDRGALDVYYTPVQMKKNRPGTLLTIVAPANRREEILSTLFTETTTIGVRVHRAERECLERRVEHLMTSFGELRVKLSCRAGQTVNIAPEFEDCLRLARAAGVPVRHVQQEAARAAATRYPIVGRRDTKEPQ